jgi:hypothetical protein
MWCSVAMTAAPSHSFVGLRPRVGPVQMWSPMESKAYVMQDSKSWGCIGVPFNAHSSASQPRHGATGASASLMAAAAAQVDSARGARVGAGPVHC